MRAYQPVLVGIIGLACGFGIGCKSRHEEGVKSNLHSQWTEVNADPRAATAAAEAVLRDQGLRDIKADSTNIDGKVSGKKADGTKVNVSIEKKSATKSQVSVTVGHMGDPKLGAEIAKKVKMQAANEAGSTGGASSSGTGTGTGTGAGGTTTTP